MSETLVNGWHDEEEAQSFLRAMRGCDNAEQRRALFLLMARSPSFSRHDLSRALGELGYADGDLTKSSRPMTGPDAATKSPPPE